MRTATILVTLAFAPAVAPAQHTMHWSWTASDTGNGDGVISPGESALLSLYAEWGGPDAIGFAGSLFDVLGTELWATGGLAVEAWNGAVVSLGDPVPQGNNDILAISAFQLPPFFNDGFDLATRCGCSRCGGTRLGTHPAS
ncbi:MAG: hypothetical protein KIS87_14470 [Phycisphaeraceae bacterium]|nr:hypothetical protein [Phycisphaeraceae bacterium]